MLWLDYVSAYQDTHYYLSFLSDYVAPKELGTGAERAV